MSDFSAAPIARTPAWLHLLGLCPLLAVSNSVANALGLALASTFVVVGSNVLIAEGYTIHCAIGEDFKAQPVPASFREVIDQFEQR